MNIIQPKQHKELLTILNDCIYKSKCCFDQDNKDVNNNYFKYMMKNPVDLQIAQLSQLYPWSNCIIQSKASGTRCLLVIYQCIVYLVFEREIKIVSYSFQNELTVFECEYMQNTGESNINLLGTLMIYDQHMWQGIEVYKQKYFFRIWKINQLIDQLCNEVNPDVKSQTGNSQVIIQQETNTSVNQIISTNDNRIITVPSNGFGYYKLKQKPFESIKEGFNQKQIENSIKRVYSSEFANDGIIINTNDPLQYQQIYKWKPIEKLTIDFNLSLIAKNEIESGTNYTYQLKAYSPDLNQPVEFTSPIVNCPNTFTFNQQLDNMVVELLYNKTNNNWEFVQIRNDKPKHGRGNSLKAARNIISNIVFNIDLNMLCSGLPNRYFEFKRPRQYEAMTKFINQVKQQQIRCIYKELKQLGVESPVVLDLGAGKGADILKFQDYNHVICIDSDKYALWELAQRTSALKTNTSITTIQANLESWSSINLLPTQTHLLNCNLALHYFIDTLPYIVRQSNPLIVNLLILDGSRIQTQQTIYENDKNGKAVINDNPNASIGPDYTIKYHYHKLHQDSDIIAVKLPFKNEYIQEQILQPQSIIDTMKDLSYSLQQYTTLDKYLLIDQTPDKLTQADKLHISNYAVLQFQLNQ